MKMLKTNSILLLCLLTFSLFAQKNFEEGYIINLEQDTVKGLILNKDKKINPKSISFNGNNQKTTFFAKDIAGFGVKNEVFETHFIEYDTSKYKTDELTVYKDPKWKEETVFLQLIVKGGLDLYRLVDNKGKKHFFIKSENDVVPQELLLIKYKKDTDVATVSKYRNTLRRYMDGSPELYETIQTLDFNVKALKRLFVNYNKSKNQFIYQYEPEKIELKFLVSIGLTVSTLKDTDNQTFPTSYNPCGGIALDVIFPKNKRKLSLLNELGFRTFETSTNEQPGPFGTSFSKNIIFKLSYLRLMTAIKYSFNGYVESNKFTPFIYAGIVNSFIISNNSTHEPFGAQPGETTAIEDDFRNYEQGVLIGIGVDYKCKFGIDLRYELTNGFSSFTSYGIRVQTIFLQFRYTF